MQEQSAHLNESMLTNPLDLSSNYHSVYARFTCYLPNKYNAASLTGDDHLEPGTCGRGMNRQPGQCQDIRPGTYSVSDQQLNLIIPLRESVHMATSDPPQKFSRLAKMELLLSSMAIRRFDGAGNDSQCMISTSRNDFVIVLAILTTQPFLRCNRCAAFI